MSHTRVNHPSASRLTAVTPVGRRPVPLTRHNQLVSKTISPIDCIQAIQAHYHSGLYFTDDFVYNFVDMKTSIHPDNYRLVVFQDEAAGFSFLTRSTAPTNETIKWEDGNEYPVVKVHISSASHPFFTGEEKIIDTEGRVDRFAAKMKAAQAHREELAKKAAAAKVKAEKQAADKATQK